MLFVKKFNHMGIDMTTLREAAAKALEALESACHGYVTGGLPEVQQAITALRAALAEPVEPVAWKDKTYESLHHQDFGNSIPLYASPPQRKQLSTEQILDLFDSHNVYGTKWVEFARAVERAHGIGEHQ